MSDNITKRVGLGTAYGFAKAGGYEGTVAEFTELLGNIAIDLARIENLSVTVTTLPAGSQATASLNGSVLSLGIPRGDKGDKGDKGDTGSPAGFGTVSATVDANIGTPSVEVTASGSDTAKNFAFAFHNLKGQKGDKGDTGDVSQAQLDAAVSDLKSALDAVNSVSVEYLGAKDTSLSDLTNLTRYQGAITSAGKWTNINANNLHIIVPVKTTGGKLSMTAGANTALYFAGVKSYSTPVSGTTLDFSEDSNWTGRITLAKNISGSWDVPDDVKYLVFVMLYNSADATPASFSITYPDGELVSLSKTFVTADEVINGFDLNPETWGVGTYSSTIGSVSSYSSNTARRYSPIYDLNYDAEIESSGDYKYMVITVDDSDIVLSLTAYIDTKSLIPKGTRFRLMLQDGADSTTDISGISDEVLNASVTIRNKDITHALFYGNVKWCCMGDSIAEGVRSYKESGETHTVTDRINGWAYLVRDRNNWDMTNIAIGGSGYLCEAAASGLHPIPSETPAWYVARHTDYTPYNLVTLSYGINDWKGNFTLGTINDDGSATTPTTIIQAMKATIEAIMESNPLCKIIVTTPLNCVGYGFNYGDKSTNYGLGYAMSNTGTLESFVNKMIEVCNYYGVQYVDMTHYSVINRENLLSCLLDGVHPSLETHDLLAHDYGKRITF